MRFLFLFWFSLLVYEVNSQSLTGVNGVFKIPSAYVFEDGTAYLGSSFLPKGYYDLYNTSSDFTGMPTFVTLSLFNRVEFMFRYTHQLGQTVSPSTQYFPDRMFAFRYNFLKESPKLPALTVGLHDVSEFFGATTAIPWFLASYVVASKSVKIDSILVQSTLGYAYDVIDNSRPQTFNGFFAGVELTASFFPYFTLVGEFDSDTFNAAVKSTIFGHLHFSIGLLDMQALSGFFTYRFNLSNR